jgi:hypothetical protein
MRDEYERIIGFELEYLGAGSHLPFERGHKHNRETIRLRFDQASGSPIARTALIINEPHPSGDAPTTFSATLKATLNNSRPHVAVFDETVDMSRFDEPNQEAILRTYITQKYSDVRFGIIVSD